MKNRKNIQKLSLSSSKYSILTILATYPFIFYVLYRFTEQNEPVSSILITIALVSILLIFLSNFKSSMQKNENITLDDFSGAHLIVDNEFDNIISSNKKFKSYFSYFAEYGTIDDLNTHLKINLKKKKYGLFNFKKDDKEITFFYSINLHQLEKEKMFLVQFFKFNYLNRIFELNKKMNTSETIALLTSITTGSYENERKNILTENNLDQKIVKATDLIYHKNSRFIQEIKQLNRVINFNKNRIYQAQPRRNQLDV